MQKRFFSCNKTLISLSILLGTKMTLPRMPLNYPAIRHRQLGVPLCPITKLRDKRIVMNLSKRISQSHYGENPTVNYMVMPQNIIVFSTPALLPSISSLGQTVLLMHPPSFGHYVVIVDSHFLDVPPLPERRRPSVQE